MLSRKQKLLQERIVRVFSPFFVLVTGLSVFAGYVANKEVVPAIRSIGQNSPTGLVSSRNNSGNAVVQRNTPGRPADRVDIFQPQNNPVDNDSVDNKAALFRDTDRPLHQVEAFSRVAARLSRESEDSEAINPAYKSPNTRGLQARKHDATISHEGDDLFIAKGPTTQSEVSNKLLAKQVIPSALQEGIRSHSSINESEISNPNNQNQQTGTPLTASAEETQAPLSSEPVNFTHRAVKQPGLETASILSNASKANGPDGLPPATSLAGSPSITLTLKPVPDAAVTITSQLDTPSLTKEVAKPIQTTIGKEGGTPVLIKTKTTENDAHIKVYVDPSGNAISVWGQGDGTLNNIWASRYQIGSGWGRATLIETNNEGSAYFPQVAVDASGNAIAVWYQSNGEQHDIWANRFVAGVGWGSPQPIETNTGNAFFPQVAVDPSGNAVAIWHQYDGERYNIWANRFVAGMGWETAMPIETNDAGSAYAPQVAVDPAGNAVAVWYQSDGMRNNIWTNRFVMNSGWRKATRITTGDAGLAAVPQVAVDALGNAIIVWYQYDGIQNNIWGSRFIAGVGWGAAQPIESNSKVTASIAP
jgi:predicted enzyme related to lactoylglutathione lyase